jgi:4-diphosphocytidyl-2-C-methyl-D-erythritol kinase
LSALTRFLAPAKLNLFLHVVGRRADGYHLLQTAFAFVDLCDELCFAAREDGVIERKSAFDAVAENDDLCVRAARLLKASSGTPLGCSIELHKRIPLGAGLGGGSSDAATTLIALNRLWNLALPRARLQALGLQLGADVPVFIFGENAFAEGVGEVLSPLALEPVWYLILVPDVHVSTKEIFAAADLTRDSIPIRITNFSLAAGRNDLEPAVLKRYPEVRECLDWLKTYAQARMTGSGAAVFAQFSSRESAESVLAEKPAAWRGFVVRGLTEHPLKAF